MGKEQKKKIQPEKIVPMKEIAIGTADDETISVYRGKIIHYVTNLEDLTERIIIEYFIPDNKEEDRRETFFYSILAQERFNLMFKFTVLAYIIRNYIPDFLDKFPDFLDVYEEIILMRNDYAHHKPFAPKYGTQEFFMLVQAKTKKNKKDLKTSLLNDTTLEIFYGKYWKIKMLLAILIVQIEEKNKKKKDG